MTEENKTSPRPWQVNEGKYHEIFLTESGGRVIAYIRNQTAFQDDELGRINAEFICEAVNSFDESRAVIASLLEAAKGYIGNGHEPTDGDVVHMPEHCRQCKLESSVAKAEKLLSEGGNNG